MAEPNNTSQLTSNYVLSQTSRSAVAGAARRAARRHTERSIDSLLANAHVIPELSDALLNDASPNTSPTDLDVSVDHVDTQDLNNQLKARNHLIFTWNAMSLQVLVYPVAVVVYLLVGSAILTTIEHGYEKMVKTIADNDTPTDEVLSTVKTILRNVNVSENVLKEILNNFTHLCTNYLEVHNASYKWEFLQTFYFVATVITTIGNMQQ